MKQRLSYLIGSLVATAVLLAGAGAAVGAEGGNAPPDVAPAVTTVQVQLEDVKFTPNQLRVVPGSTVRFELTNSGMVPHDFTVQAWNVSKLLGPGESATVKVQVPEGDGSIPFKCDQKGHAAAGMVGVITVGAGGPAGAAAEAASGTARSGVGAIDWPPVGFWYGAGVLVAFGLMTTGLWIRRFRSAN